MKLLLLGLIGITAVSIMDAYFTFLNKRILDEAIIPGNRQALVQLFTVYGAIVLGQSLSFFIFIYFVGLQGERVRYDLRKNSSTICRTSPWLISAKRPWVGS